MVYICLNSKLEIGIQKLKVEKDFQFHSTFSMLLFINPMKLMIPLKRCNIQLSFDVYLCTLRGVKVMNQHTQVSKICGSRPLSNLNWFDFVLVLGIVTTKTATKTSTNTTTKTTTSLPELPTRGTLLLIKSIYFVLLLLCHFAMSYKRDILGSHYTLYFILCHFAMSCQRNMVDPA